MSAVFCILVVREMSTIYKDRGCSRLSRRVVVPQKLSADSSPLDIDFIRLIIVRTYPLLPCSAISGAPSHTKSRWELSVGWQGDTSEA